MTTILSSQGELEVAPGNATADKIDAEHLWLSPTEMATATGWELKPEGLCKDDACVPIPPGREAEFVRGDVEINAARFWQHLDQPLAKTEQSDVWYLGEGATQRNDALSSLQAPEFTLPDFSGKLHSLTDFRRQRVLLITWASW